MDINRVYRALITGFRRRRMRRFERVFRPTSQTRILDVGGTRFNWELVESQASVTLLNIRPATRDGRPGRFIAVTGSGTRLPYPDASFDIGFSNSVIEHVGTREAQAAFAAELRRVARGLWVQTPARWFFFEPHLLTPFIHFLPCTAQRRLVRNFTVWGWLTRPDAARVERKVGETRLLTYREFAALFPECDIQRERFLGWTKSYVAMRRAPGEATGRRGRL